ncbi:MAG: VIT1/CCC1 transporter family protein [Acidimicrobiia bacterium]|nr:MAG: VIT1/CCC1 transporter family protein [Acidimicrobiia bacterium]
MAKPRSTPVPETYVPHLGEARQYLRDVILGVNDGLVSTFLLVAGVVGAGMDATAVLLTGIAGAVAGLISMGAGEYIATKSQEEVFQAEMALEIEHLADHREHERAELRDMFGDMGLDGADLETLVGIIDSNDDVMLGVMAGLEFGVVDTERRSPWLAAATSAVLFLVGAFPSVLPFALTDDTGFALLIAAVLSGIGLLIVGVGKTVMTKTNPFVSGTENLLIGLVGGAISFTIGRIVEGFIST